MSTNPFVKHPGRLAESDADVLAWLLEEVQIVDTQPVTLLTLERKLSPAHYAQVMVSLHYGQIPQGDSPPAIATAGRVRGLFNALSVGGLDLFEDYHQEQLGVLGDEFGWPQELTQAVQQISRPVVPRWKDEGIENEPPIDAVTAWRAEILAEAASKQAMQSYRDSHSSHIAPVLDGPKPTRGEIVAALRNAADEMEAAG